ncbi:MAG: hypothetical protein ACUZ8E_18140 [Candidatus Anammoxibacter sp.]
MPNKAVDFVASDAFMSNETLEKVDKDILHIPICLGAVLATYNVSGNPGVVGQVEELLKSVLESNNHKWFIGKMDTKEKESRKS